MLTSIKGSVILILSFTYKKHGGDHMLTQQQKDTIRMRILAAVNTILEEELDIPSTNVPENIVQRFLAETCQTGGLAEIQSSTLYEGFVDWKNHNDIHIDFSNRLLSQTINGLNLPNVRLTKKKTGSVFVGIKLLGGNV